MPNVIRRLINHAKDTGEWNPVIAAKKYFRDNRARSPKMLPVFKEIRLEIINSTKPCATVKITPHLINRVAKM